MRSTSGATEGAPAAHRRRHIEDCQPVKNTQRETRSMSDATEGDMRSTSVAAEGAPTAHEASSHRLNKLRHCEQSREAKYHGKHDREHERRYQKRGRGRL